MLCIFGGVNECQSIDMLGCFGKIKTKKTKPYISLIEKTNSTTDYNQIILTPLGVEINSIFSLDLVLKKSRLNLNFKYLY